MLSGLYKTQPVNWYCPATPYPSHNFSQKDSGADGLYNHIIHPGGIGFKDLCFMMGWQKKQNGSNTHCSEFFVKHHRIVMRNINIDHYKIRHFHGPAIN